LLWADALVLSEKIYDWRITRIPSTPAALIGHVEAPYAGHAIKEAIAKYEISRPHEQARLAARRVKEVRP
jgi:hypothetical protein